jgi:transposase InsO family protein
MKGKLGVSSRYQHIFYGTPLYNGPTMKRLISTEDFSRSEIAEFRLKVIEFHKTYGTAATKDAFGVSKATIYRWKGKLKESNGRLNSLIPHSTEPKHKRQMLTPTKIISFIRQIREEHPRLGKEKIKPFLDKYCFVENIKTISESTIGKVIKRKGLLKPKRYGRYYHNPADKRTSQKPCYKHKVKRSPKPQEFGYIEIDSVVKFISGMKVYIFNAIDIKLKFEFSYTYTRLNSKNGLDFIKKFEEVYPLKAGIKIVQTDNGHEFMGLFDDYLKKSSIKHLFIYPRCPKINSFIERSNRSLRDDFVDDNLDYVLTSIAEFNSRLIEHLIWYNTERPHKGLNNKSPIDYLLSVSPESQKYVTYTG